MDQLHKHQSRFQDFDRFVHSLATVRHIYKILTFSGYIYNIEVFFTRNSFTRSLILILQHLHHYNRHVLSSFCLFQQIFLLLIFHKETFSYFWYITPILNESQH